MENNTNNIKNAPLRGMLDKGFRDKVLKMDAFLRRNTKVENGKHVIVANPQDLIKATPEKGALYVEEKGFKTANDMIVDIRVFLNNNNRHDLSTAYWFYKDQKGNVRKSGNDILICDTKKETGFAAVRGGDYKGRNAFFRQKVDRRRNGASSDAATAETAAPEAAGPAY